MKQALVGILVAAVVGFLWLRDHDAQVKSKLLFAQRDSARADSLKNLRADMVTLTARRDTLLVTRTKLVNHFDTLATTLLTHDTVTFHDTLYVKASTAEAAVNACRPIITVDDRISSTCEERIANALAQAKIEGNRRVDASDQQPGYLRRHVGVVVGYGAYLDGSGLKLGPSITAGLRIWP